VKIRYRPLQSPRSVYANFAVAKAMFSEFPAALLLTLGCWFCIVVPISAGSPPVPIPDLGSPLPLPLGYLDTLSQRLFCLSTCCLFWVGLALGRSFAFCRPVFGGWAKTSFLAVATVHNWNANTRNSNEKRGPRQIQLTFTARWPTPRGALLGSNELHCSYQKPKTWADIQWKGGVQGVNTSNCPDPCPLIR